MNKYLRAIGFSNLHTLAETNKLIANVLAEPTNRSITTISAETAIMQITKEYDPDFGIHVIGELDADENFHMEYFFPYVNGTSSVIEDNIAVEAHFDREAYAGVSENTNIGIPLIFFIQNVAEYVQYRWSNAYLSEIRTCSYCALASDGAILLGIEKLDEDHEREEHDLSRTAHLIRAARKGDSDAIETLAMEDMDLYTNVSNRVQKEDLYTIIETSFLPFGISSDNYAIIGTIESFEPKRNPVTNEQLYLLNVSVNHIALTVLINAADLLGEPEIGRRFKGNIWLQGHLYI